MSKTVELKVGMSCQGCVGAVKRVLGKLDGVESFDIDIEKQKVTVKGNVEPDVVFQTVSKTGKATAFWEAPPPAATAPAPEPPAAEAPTPEASVAEPEIKPSETVTAA